MSTVPPTGFDGTDPDAAPAPLGAADLTPAGPAEDAPEESANGVADASGHPSGPDRPVEDPLIANCLSAVGWTDALADSFAEHAAAGLVPGRVIAIHRETSIVATADGDRTASVTGRLRHEALLNSDYPAVGDWVALDPGLPERTDTAVIAAILPRRTSFRRAGADSSRSAGARLAAEQVMAANVDVALLVAGLDNDFNLRRMERYLAVAAACRIEAVVVLNKVDVAQDLDERRAAIEAIAPDVRIVPLSARAQTGLGPLADVLRPGTTAVILGSSGVGKSTLVNALLGEDRQATAAVRGSDDRGRHTTTHRELFVLPSGALLIDTPGIRSLEVLGAEEGVDESFADIDELAALCRFSDCRHTSEPGCAVQAAIAAGTLDEARLGSRRKLERELAHAARETDPRARAEEQRRWKLIHKSVNEHMSRKYGEDR